MPIESKRQASRGDTASCACAEGGADDKLTYADKGVDIVVDTLLEAGEAVSTMERELRVRAREKDAAQAAENPPAISRGPRASPILLGWRRECRELLRGVRRPQLRLAEGDPSRV